MDALPRPTLLALVHCLLHGSSPHIRPLPRVTAPPPPSPCAQPPAPGHPGPCPWPPLPALGRCPRKLHRRPQTPSPGPTFMARSRLTLSYPVTSSCLSRRTDLVPIHPAEKTPHCFLCSRSMGTKSCPFCLKKGSSSPLQTRLHCLDSRPIICHVTVTLGPGNVVA